MAKYKTKDKTKQNKKQKSMFKLCVKTRHNDGGLYFTKISHRMIKWLSFISSYFPRQGSPSDIINYDKTILRTI